MFTQLGLSHIHNTRGVTNHLLDVPKRQTSHCETSSITSIALSVETHHWELPGM